MKTKEHIPLYKRLIDDELIIGESVSNPSIDEVKKTIDWYEKIKKKFGLKEIRILRTKVK